MIINTSFNNEYRGIVIDMLNGEENDGIVNIIINVSGGCDISDVKNDFNITSKCARGLSDIFHRNNYENLKSKNEYYYSNDNKHGFYDIAVMH